MGGKAAGRLALSWTYFVTLACGPIIGFASLSPPIHNPLISLNSPPPSQQAILASVLNHDETLSSCKPTGQISDARCDYETVEMDINSANFFPILDNLRREKYFRLYKVDLYKDCPFWNDDSLCMSRDCTVSKVDERSIPEEYQSAALSSVKTTDESAAEDSDAEHSSHNHNGLPDTCQCADTDFCHWEDEEWSPESAWVDLIDNPEGFTGYAGTSAHRVWRAIYEENCFGVARAVGASMASSAGAAYDKQVKSARLGDPGSASAAAEALSSLLAGQSTPLDTSSSESEQCLEKRVFYKIISGLHTSISIHICHDYLDQQTGEWKPNLACFVERIAQHPDRLQNLYFAHTVLVRSLAKLAERLEIQASGTQSILRGKAVNSQKVANLAPGLPSPFSATSTSLASLLLQASMSPPTFDEASMFDKSNPESEYLRNEFRDRFRNVSRIMDCVGCDKCRLWGKLQVNGVGTALKILFEANQLSPQRLLQRSELVALINTVHRISESIRAVEVFRSLYKKELESTNHGKQGSSRRQSELKRDDTEARNARSTQTNHSSHRHSLMDDDASFLSHGISTTGQVWQRIMELLHRAKRSCENRWTQCLSWMLRSAGPYGGSRSDSRRTQDEL